MDPSDIDELGMDYDVLLLHPPAIYDFRKRPIFPGPIGYTVRESTDQFVIPPVGMLSIADYLDRNGCKVAVNNLGELMASDPAFDVERHLRGIEAKVYAVGLHWCVHSQGAVEVARLCKRLHPESTVVMGGLTATRFSREIATKYPFVDAVVRGEAEKPMLQLVGDLEQGKGLASSPNTTSKLRDGRIVEAPMMKPSESLDEFEFTRLDLLEPNGIIFSSDMPSHWSLPVCRGCVYNCATCGGSAYSYRTYLGRESPTFRSPKKIVEDIQGLCEQGVRLVFLFQDPRMGGKKYCDELISRLSKERMPLEGLTIELFSPASDEYVAELSRTGVPISLTISPESGVSSMRMAHGRRYTDEALWKTIENCQKHAVHLMVFFMLGLADETRDTARQSWDLWQKISSFDGSSGKDGPSVNYSFGPMVLLDPGSLAFDSPEKYGYRLLARSLEDYVENMSLPSWHQWVSYETRNLDRKALVELIIDSIEHSIGIREKFGIYSRSEAAKERLRFVDANRWLVGAVDRAMRIEDRGKRLAELESIKATLDSYRP